MTDSKKDDNNISEILMLVNGIKTAALELIREGAKIHAESDERSKAHELAVLQNGDHEYAMARLKIQGDIDTLIVTKAHERAVASYAALEKMNDQTYAIIKSLADRFPIEKIGGRDWRDASFETNSKLDRLAENVKAEHRRAEERSAEFGKRLEGVSRMAQATKDRVDNIKSSNGKAINQETSEH